MSLSIRWRLTLWNTLGLAVMLLVFAAMVYALLRHALYEQIDRKLQSALGQLAQDRRMAAEPETRLRYWIYEWKEHENLLAVAYDPDGSVRDRSEELAVDSVPSAPETGAGDHRIDDRVIPILGRQRVLEGSQRLGNSELSLIIMAPLDDVDHELAELRAVLLTAVPVVLLLSGGLGYVLARKALAPMERLRRSTEEITADRLDRRLPVANSEDELGRLTETINAMIGRLERSFAEIRRLTADASHELRTPLTAIRMEAEVALGRPITSVECQHLLGSILEECDRLTRLTDQLLTLSREDAGSGKQVREVLDLAVLVEDVVETMRPLAVIKKLHLSIQAKGSFLIRGDESRLRQVFYNLLDNAIKYTPEGGKVEVTLDRSEGVVKVSMRDTGIGIPPEHLPRVFERFYRVDKARGRAEGGTGLGLSIVQSIVAAHGGRVELASSPGEGTTCLVALPAESAA
jgi:two-component system, OmpR family, heavy metal sensor histidine kinase CusS